MYRTWSGTASAPSFPRARARATHPNKGASETGAERGGGASHDAAAPLLARGGAIRVLGLVDGAPDGRDEVVLRALAVPDQAGARPVSGTPPCGIAGGAHLEDASLTRMRERPRSSRRRWLCSSRRRSLSSDIDCFARELMVGYGWRGREV
jgi:hypothetical protein